MNPLPVTQDTMVIRTDYSNQTIWEEVKREMLVPDPDLDDYQAQVEIIEDATYEGLTPEAFLSHLSQAHPFFCIADRLTMLHPEHPLLCVDLSDMPGESFRFIPPQLAGIEANLSIANMFFFEFRDAVDADGVFRGFSLVPPH